MAPRNRTNPEIRIWIRDALKAGDTLAFSVVEADRTKSFSHQIMYRQGLYTVTGIEGEQIGKFRTITAANSAGFAASAEKLQHGIK